MTNINIKVISLFLVSIPYSQTTIGEGLLGEALLDHLVNNYKTTTTLGYTHARDTLYGTIDLRDGDQLSCVYSGYTITLDTSEDPSTNAYNQGINCEHTWPQSMGAGDEPQKSDLHHLFPCKSNVNSSRGNHPYADINDEDTDTWYRNDYSQQTIPTEFIDEYAEKFNGQNAVFEPREDHKGDAARAVFYFFAMYQDHADTNFWNVQKNSLLDWHNLDPADDLELSRTWVIAQYQEDYPNPFILDSSLARRIWFVESYDENHSPGEFTLSLPEDNSTIINLMPEFVWTPSVDIDPLDIVNYTLLLDTPDPGIESYLVGTDTNFVIENQLQDNSQYFWQVIAEDLIGNHTISQGGYISFYTNIENEAPTSFDILSPNQNSIQMDLSPNFSWTQSIDPDPLDSVRYRLEIFGPVIDYYPWQYTVIIEGTNFTPDFSLYDNSRFSFNVTASDLHGDSVHTQEYIFYTDSFPEPPSNFATIFPENNEEGLGTEIQFIWNASADPDPQETIQYQLVYTTNWQDSTTYVYSELLYDTSIHVVLEDNAQYFWSIIARDSDGFAVGSNDNTPNTFMIGMLSNEKSIKPVSFKLHQNYPNPFNPITNITYDLPEASFVNLAVFDLSGNFVKNIVNKYQNIGYKSVQWDAKNSKGQPVPTGVYIYRISAGKFTNMKKMVILK